ncbi:MAG: HU family DNA-binding protein [Prevotellaceae bacterium]|jgi:nucleoid DNA-binding protein/nucleoid-associated protein YgaU|nr:HU family DNA-binding protein [Prevotellaceae bacterium]
MPNKQSIQEMLERWITQQGISTQHARAFTDAFFATIVEGLEKDRYVKIKGLGTFKLTEIESRESINVNTGERFEIEGHTKVSFTPETEVRERINKPFAHFETVVLNENVSFTDLEETSPPDSPPSPIEPTTKPVKPEPPKKVSPPAKKQTPKHPVKPKVKPPFPWWRTILIGLLTLAIIYMIYDLTTYDDNEPPIQTTIEVAVPDTIPTITVEPVPTDSIEILSDTDGVWTSDTTLTEEMIVPEFGPEGRQNDGQPTPTRTTTTPKRTTTTAPVSTTTPVHPDSTSYEIIGTKATHVLQPGETLIRVSLQYYGTKDLWPYLLIHNRTKLRNPNVVPVGAELQIPELRKK